MNVKYTRLVAVMFSALLIIAVSCESKKAAEEDATEETASAEAKVEEEEKMEESHDEPVASPRKQSAGSIDGISVTVDYGSPAVKERKIWGGLEEYGAVWRAGANQTTSVEFDQNVKIGDNVVEAGKYGLYMIPNENADWTVIINTDWDREKHGAWGAYNYNKENDVARIDVTPEWSEENQERLEYAVTNTAVTFAWEKARLSIPVVKAGE